MEKWFYQHPCTTVPYLFEHSCVEIVKELCHYDALAEWLSKVVLVGVHLGGQCSIHNPVPIVGLVQGKCLVILAQILQPFAMELSI